MAASEWDIVVEQGDRRYEVDPLSNDESVEAFYDYRNAQSHTSTGIEREGVSSLFLYEDADGLSLVVIHDRPYRGSGGAVDFAFDGLPDDGSWVVRDDGGDFRNDQSAPPEYVTWAWDETKTDGGVFSGSFDGGIELTLDPAFNEEASRNPLSSGRVEEWHVLSGDAADPARHELALDQPITIRVSQSETSLERELAETYAPAFGYDSIEPWYPTDPLNYTEERDGETVVDGITALDEYTEEFKETETPPDPTVFYDVEGCEDPGAPLRDQRLIAVRYWRYYAFDQFLNFHWHDSEKFHVFVDTERMEPVLYVANAHLNWCPNNEFLDEDGTVGSAVRILSELGAHASALDLNDDRSTFERFDSSGSIADVTNGGDLKQLLELYWSEFDKSEFESDSSHLPAYGLPRDEDYGVDELFGQTDFVMPELDGEPVYRDPRLPNVEESDLITGVRSEREHDVWFTPRATDDGGSYQYELRPLDEVKDTVDDFVGPELAYPDDYSEENPFPNTVGIPWEAEWYDDPTEVIYHKPHREWVQENYDVDLGEDPSSIITAVQELTDSVEGRLREEYEQYREELEELGETFEDVVTTTRDSIEDRVIAAIDSPETIPAPSSLGFVAANDVTPGEHHLRIVAGNHAGYSEWFHLGDAGDVHVAGASGNLCVTPESEAVTLTTRSEDHDLERIAVTEDFAGDVYESEVPSDQRFETSIHASGRYAVEVTDRDGETGVHRIDPDDGGGEVAVDELETGPEPSIGFLVRYLEETIDMTETFTDSDGSEDGRGNGERSLTSKYDNAIDALERARSGYRSGKERRARRQVEAARNKLESAVNQLESEDSKFGDGAKVILIDRTESSIDRCDDL